MRPEGRTKISIAIRTGSSRRSWNEAGVGDPEFAHTYATHEVPIDRGTIPRGDYCPAHPQPDGGS
jgi:hypothetical protein